MQPDAPYSVGANTIVNSIAVGDMNQDGYWDIEKVNSTSSHDGTVSVLNGNGFGGFTLQVSKHPCTVGADPLSLAIADMNGDNVPEVVVANGGSGGSGDQTVSTLLGQLTQAGTATLSGITLSGLGPYEVNAFYLGLFIFVSDSTSAPSCSSAQRLSKC